MSPLQQRPTRRPPGPIAANGIDPIGGDRAGTAVAAGAALDEMGIRAAEKTAPEVAT
jgi:hypothetical protein